MLSRFISRIFVALLACAAQSGFVGPADAAVMLESDGRRLRHIVERAQSSTSLETLVNVSSFASTGVNDSRGPTSSITNVGIVHGHGWRASSGASSPLISAFSPSGSGVDRPITSFVLDARTYMYLNRPVVSQTNSAQYGRVTVDYSGSVFFSVSEPTPFTLSGKVGSSFTGKDAVSRASFTIGPWQADPLFAEVEEHALGTDTGGSTSARSHTFSHEGTLQPGYYILSWNVLGETRDTFGNGTYFATSDQWLEVNLTVPEPATSLLPAAALLLARRRARLRSAS
jgi:hypothetical protein